MILLDTDHFSVLMDARHRRHATLVSRLENVTEPFSLPIVSVEEQLRAWLAQVRRVHDAHQLIPPYGRLLNLLDVIADWNLAQWTPAAADEFNSLRAQQIRIGTQDLRIAAIALSTKSTLLSANLRDFRRVPNLLVEDWLYGAT